jgi:hypothetical protein
MVTPAVRHAGAGHGATRQERGSSGNSRWRQRNGDMGRAGPRHGSTGPTRSQDVSVPVGGRLGPGRGTSRSRGGLIPNPRLSWLCSGGRTSRSRRAHVHGQIAPRPAPLSTTLTGRSPHVELAGAVRSAPARGASSPRAPQHFPHERLGRPRLGPRRREHGVDPLLHLGRGELELLQGERRVAHDVVLRRGNSPLT